jgi:hypothetical protein
MFWTFCIDMGKKDIVSKDKALLGYFRMTLTIMVLRPQPPLVIRQTVIFYKYIVGPYITSGCQDARSFTKWQGQTHFLVPQLHYYSNNENTMKLKTRL